MICIISQFKDLSNDIVSSCISNRPVSLSFERVRILSITSTTPLIFETFQFIERTFPNIKTLILTDFVKFSGLEYKDKQKENISHINDDLLSNISLQLRSVNKFCFLSQFQCDNYQIFRRFIHLLPNLAYLQMFIGRALFREILEHKYKDISVSIALEGIKFLQMVHFYDEKNILSDDEIHRLFPNAQILFRDKDL